ncbi:MAG: hypothetical protein LM577_07705, partial [Thermoproteaceae archaeon]|nr:hypothetical protein [Thermoproteaceae archaeon]
GERWVEWDVAQVRWRATLKSLRDVIVQVCYSVLDRPVYTIHDLMDCYRSIDRARFIWAVRQLYEPAVLSIAVGKLELTNDKTEVKVDKGPAAKLVAEYYFSGWGATTSATVGVYPVYLRQPATVETSLTVALLPVSITLYQYANERLPRAPYLTVAGPLENVMFAVEGGGVLFSRAGTEAVVKNPWNNTIMLALPPYDVAPLVVGRVELHPLSFFNASGYLPLSPLYGVVCAVDRRGVEYYNVADIEEGRSAYICGVELKNLRDFFRAYTEISATQGYTIEAFLGGVRVGIARLESGRYAVDGTTGYLVETPENLQRALHPEFEVIGKKVEDVEKIYNAEVRSCRGRLYCIQHFVYMAIAALTLNVLPRDLCGSPLPGGRLAVTVVTEAGNYTQEASLQKYQYEVPVFLTLPVDDTGLITAKHVELAARLHYYGYELGAVNRTTLRPATVRVPVEYLPYAKPELYFPVSPLLFSVWGVTPEGARKDRLSGFVVSMYSTRLKPAVGEMSRSISNLTKYTDPVSDRYGYAYIEGAPIGEEYPFRVVVRTIMPEADAAYPYSLAQHLRRNSYGTYLIDMVGGPEYAALRVVYTLGTRGAADAGIVVYNSTMVLTRQNFTQYVCARKDIPLDVWVYDLEVRVYDRTGRYLLNATEAFFGPYPLASDKRVVPVALVIPDTQWYMESSRMYGPYWYVATSYAVLGLTGVRDKYEAAAGEYFDKMRKAACEKPVNMMQAVYNYPYAAFYNYVANASTRERTAVFRISSVQPKYVPYVCDMTPDVPGTREFARLFLRGQRYRLQVWYLGYKVFDGWVTVTSPRVNITTDAVPVRIEAVTKSGRLPVDAYAALTFADALAGLAYVSDSVLPREKVDAARALLGPLDSLVPVTKGRLELLEKDHARDYVYYSPTVVCRNAECMPVGMRMPFTAGIEYSLPWAAMVYRNLTDVEGAGISMERRPYYPRDGVIHGAVFLQGREMTVTERKSTTEIISISRTARSSLNLSIAVSNVASPAVLSIDVVNATCIRSVTVAAGANIAAKYGTIEVSGSNYTDRPSTRIFSIYFNGSVTFSVVTKAPACIDRLDVRSGSVYLRASSPFVVTLDHIVARVNATNITTVTVPVPVTIRYPGGEYVVGIPRWIRTLEAGAPVYYWSAPEVSLTGVPGVWPWGLLDWLNVAYARPIRLEYDETNKVYRGEIELWTRRDDVFELLTYRTLAIRVPYAERCYVGGTKSGTVEVRRYSVRLKIEARFLNDTLIDSKELSLSDMVKDAVEETPEVRIPLLFGRVAAIAKHVDPDTGSGVGVKFKLEMQLVDEYGEKAKYGSYCRGPTDEWSAQAVTFMPAEVVYDVAAAPARAITTEGVALEEGKYTIYSTPVYNYENKTTGHEWRVLAAVPQIRAGDEWTGVFGFGAPITVEFRAGEVAVLPAWANNTAGHGSRIARVWLYVYDNETKPARLTEARVKVVNFVPSVGGWKVTRTYWNEFASAGGSGDLWGLGFMTSGTSAVVYSAIGLAPGYSDYRGYAFWNSTELFALAQKLGGSIRLPTAALDEVEVANAADYPVIIAGVKVREAGVKVPVLIGGTPAWISEEAVMIPAEGLVRVDVAGTGRALLKGYGFGMTYDISGTGRAWVYQLLKNAPNYTAAVYYGACDDAVGYFAGVDAALADKAADVCGKLEPLTGPYVPQTVLYASHHEEKPKYFTVDSVVLDGRVTATLRNVTKGEWRKFKNFTEIKLEIRSDDTAYKYLFELPRLPLVSVRDWNDRALANQTVALFGVDRDGKVHLYAVTYTTSAGTLRYPLPDIRAMPDIVRAIVKVSWFFGYLHELATGQTQYTIWVYDSGVENDVLQLGDALTRDKVRTYVYPLAATATDELGRPLANMYVKVIDVQTRGALVTAMNRTDSTGTTKVFDERVSKYPTGPMSQIPAADYEYYIYDETGMLVATGTYSIQRGATVPAEGWNIRATVRYVSEIPVRNAGTRGYVRVYDIRVVDPRTGEERTVPYIDVPFVIAEGVMRLERRIPALAAYPVEVYVTHVTVGGEEVPSRLLKPVFTGRASDLLAGLDFAELGVTGIVTASAVDATGKVRPDWVVRLETTVNGKTITAAEGRGSLRAVVPRSAVIGANYTVRVITTAMTPAGAPLVREVPLNVTEKAHALEVPVRTVAVAVQAVDGFGKVRSD